MRIEHRCLVRLTCAGCNKSEALVLVLEWSTSQCLGTHFPGSWYAVVAGAVSNVGWRPALFFFVCKRKWGSHNHRLKKTRILSQMRARCRLPCSTPRCKGLHLMVAVDTTQELMGAGLPWWGAYMIERLELLFVLPSFPDDRRLRPPFSKDYRHPPPYEV